MSSDSDDGDLLLPNSAQSTQRPSSSSGPGSAARRALRNFTATANLSDTSEDEAPAKPSTAAAAAPGKGRMKLPSTSPKAAPAKGPTSTKAELPAISSNRTATPPSAAPQSNPPAKSSSTVAAPPPSRPAPTVVAAAPPVTAASHNDDDETSEVDFQEADSGEENVFGAPGTLSVSPSGAGQKGHDLPPAGASAHRSSSPSTSSSKPLSITPQTASATPAGRNTSHLSDDLSKVSLNLDSSVQRTPMPAGVQGGTPSPAPAPAAKSMTGKSIVDKSPRERVAELRERYSPKKGTGVTETNEIHADPQPPAPAAQPQPQQQSQYAAPAPSHAPAPAQVAPHKVLLAPSQAQDDDEEANDRDPALDDILPPRAGNRQNATMGAPLGVGRAGTPDRHPRPSAQSPAPTDPRDTDSVATSSAVIGANAAAVHQDYSRPGGNSPNRMGAPKPTGPSLVEGIQDRNRRELIMRAQERLQRRDSGPSHLAGAGGGGGRGPSPSAESAFGGAQTARLSTFTRMSSQPDAGVFQGKDRERLMKENQRLTEEVAFLQKDNQRMRQGMVEGHSSEAQRLRTLLEESEAHRKESELGFARIRLQLEAQLKDAAEHEKALKEELRAYSVTLEQFESVCAEKDQQLNAERSTTHRLRQELKDKELEASRAISDALQQKEDFQIRLDRVSELLEDAKKQRTHLLELNDKFGRDKEAALSEKRRSAEELKTAQLELARQSERFADETAASRREVERYKALLTEKERVLGLRIADEQRSREHYQKRHSEVEEQLSSIKTHHQEMIRTIQDEHRRQMDSAREEIAKANAKCRAAETESELLQKRFDEKFDMERRQLVEEMNGLYAQLEKENKQLKDQLGAAQFTAQQAIEDREAANAGYQRLRQEKAALEEKAAGLEKELNRVTQTLESLLSSDDRVQQEREDLKRELEQSKLQISRMKDDVAMCAALEDQLQELSTENERLSEECGRLAKDRGELWSENHRLESELAQWRGEAQELRAVLKGRGTASARGYNAAPASDFTY